MSKRAEKFYPGWKMTPAQHRAYFKIIEGVYRARGITKTADKQAMRKQVHTQAFGLLADGKVVSAKDIDHMKMFDEFKSVCLAMSHPDNLDAQIRQTEQPLIRLRHAILKFPISYIVALLCSPRFKKQSLADLDDMTEKELTDLRNTLSARGPKNGDRAQAPDESDLSGEEEFKPELEDQPF